MAENKRNVTGSYPGAGGAPKPKKNTNPSGSYPGKKKPAVSQETRTIPKVKKETAAQPEAAPKKAEPKQPKEKKKKFKFANLFSKETLNKYWKTMVYYACILLVSIALSAWICDVGNEVLALIRPDKEITVMIPEKSSTMEIAKELKDAGVIDHPYIFNLYCKLKKEGSSFKGGEYTVNCNQDYNQLISALKRSSVSKTMVSFTIEPGDTQEDVVTTLCDSLGYLERAELEEVLQNYDFSEYSFLRKLPKRNYRLEGYLCPGTYEMHEGESALAVVQRILDKFQETVLTEENNKKIKNSDYSLDELITLASILQEEGGNELARSAGVYYNRLSSKSFPYLESQATVAYILPAGHGKVTVSDIRTNDPYNTYRTHGLPTGPITNPGADAIAAVLTPEKSDMQFFVCQSDGTTLFAVDLATHQANLKKAGENARGTGTVA